MKPPIRSRAFRERQQDAFSLVEILVSVGLLAFIIVGLLAMFYQTQRAFRSSATQTDVLEAGRAVMQMLRQDLQDLHSTESPSAINFQALYDSVKSAPVLVDLPPQSAGGGTLSFSVNDLSFMKRLNDVWAAVGYRIDSGALGLGSLYRREDTLDYLDTFDPYADFQGLPGLTNASLAIASAQVSDQGFHRVIDGVVHFTITPYDTNGLPYGNAFAFSAANGRSGYSFRSNALPGFVDVELAILEPKALEQIRARTNSPTLAPALLYLRNHADRIHLFRERIPIRTRS